MRHLCREPKRRQFRSWQTPESGRMYSTSRLFPMRRNDPQICLRRQIRIWEKERDRALQSVQKEIGTLAMAAAVKIIGENSSKVTDEQLYNEFLSKTGDKHDSNNG